MTRGWFLLPLVAATACASAELTPDAGGGEAPDADLATPDAAPGAPDARPDAGVIQMPIDASVPTPTPDAAPTPDPDAAPCSPVWIDLLTNGGFDSGTTGWTATGGAVIADSATMPISAYGGTHAAWLAGYNSANEELYQTVSVPADATALRITGVNCYVTADTTGAHDFFYIRLRNGGGTVLETLESLSNEDVGAVCGWTSFLIDSAAGYAGQTIQLYFNATTDSSYPSSFYVDSLTFEAYACP